VYKIGYVITFYDAASPNSGGAITSSFSNEVYIALLDGHTYNIYVQASYFDSNVEVPDTRSAQSNSIVVSIAIGPPPPASLIANVVTNPADLSNYVLSITGSNFGKGEQVLITVVWRVEGESDALFQLWPVTTDTLFGGFSTAFTGVVPSGLCPITVPFGQPQPPQRFQVTARGLTSNKTASTTAGPFTCPFS
jgi:hypothetical protein